MNFHHVVCGGTFDHLHLGHKKLLAECIRQGERVTVGITAGALARHKAYPFFMQSYSVRAKNISRFNSSFSLYQLKDIYGPTLTDDTIDAICVTKDTFFGAEMINKKRNELAMKPLFIIVVPFAYDENNEKISSEHIRQGVVNREGKRYDIYLLSKERHVLPESLRGELRKPLGHVVSSFSALSKQQIEDIKGRIIKRGSHYQCAVGDRVTWELKKRGITSFISIIDGLTQRKALNKELLESILEKDRSNEENEKGMIQKSACFEVQRLFDMGQKRATKQLYIRGEEDLLTLAAVLLAPLGAHVWYGLRDKGAVDVRVTEKTKQTVYNLLRQFK